MSDRPVISLHEAISGFAGGTPETEQAKSEAAPTEDDLTPEAEDQSQSDDDTEEQLAEGEEAEQDSEEDDPGATDDEEPGEEEEEEPSFTVKIDGKEQAVSLSELRDGYLRQADYTRKTQAFVEQRKALDTQAEQVALKRNEAIAILEAIPQQLLGTPPAKPDISLMRSDPQTYEEQKYAFEQWHALKAGFDQWRGKVVQEREQQTHAARADVAKAEGQKFLQAFAEEVKDEATMNAKVAEVHTYLHDAFGYAPQELAGMIDHRAYVIADKARRYDALMAENKPKAELKAKKARLKPVSSGAAQRKPQRTSERDQARNRFIESTERPSHALSRKEQIDAAAAAMMAGKSGR